PPPAGYPQPGGYPQAGGWPPAGAIAPAGHGSVGAAIVGGVVAAAVAGAIWCAVVAATNYQIAYLAIGVGWLTAQGVLAGSNRRPRLPLQVLAALCTLISCVVSQYYIIKVEVAQLGADLPMIPSPGDFTDLVRASLEEDPLTGLFWLAAVVTAFFVTGSADRSAFRPNS
ncbi:MAG: hypothetical protein H0W25_02455, partial [Acidimicrobiia bacterium]|nr:hypothetical protein [Acidimicrobiia bacterium]